MRALTELGAVVDGHALVQVLWTSTVAALAVTVAFAIAIHGATRAMDRRREGRIAEATAFGVAAGLGLAVVAGAVLLPLLSGAREAVGSALHPEYTPTRGSTRR